MKRVPARYRLRRWLLAGFQMLASARMLASDRQPLRAWPGHLLPRLGYFRERAARSIWIHGEGMGEFNAARPLIASLRDELPDLSFVFTASRSVTLEWLRSQFPDDLHVPHPWDTRGAVSRFVHRLNPQLIVLLEFHDAFCPGALLWAREAGVPRVVVNARSLHPGRPWRFRVAAWLGLVRATAALIDRFLAQDEATVADLLHWRVPQARVSAVGNLKYDFTPPLVEGLRHQWGLPAYAPVLIAGCIHPDEEGLIATMIQQLQARYPKLRFLVAPYSPTQIAPLESRLHAAGIPTRRVSEDSQEGGTAVLLIDTFGMLSAAYALAQLVVLGGSFTPANAGHSLVEAAAHGKAIVVGPHTVSQTTMVRRFVAAEAALQVPASELVPALERLLETPTIAIEMGDRARTVVAQNAGGTTRTLAALKTLLPGRGAVGHSLGADRAEENVSNIAPPRVAFARGSPGTIIKSTLKTLALTRPGQILLATRSQRVPTLEALREALNHPDTILCLGNGPSSEEACLRRIAYDALFRVNWRWVGRGQFERPDVVFTGDRDALRRCPPCLFGFRTIAEEVSVLLNTLADRRRGRAAYFTVERLPLWLNRTWPARPTNGAVMIAVAAALQPRCLVIGGIDLFQHPAGRYPGAPSENAYAAMHDRAVEVAILREALARFAGDVRIVSPVLKETLALPARSASIPRAA